MRQQGYDSVSELNGGGGGGRMYVSMSGRRHNLQSSDQTLQTHTRILLASK